MKEARAIAAAAAAAASLPSHCLIISCPKSSPKLQIWNQIFFIIIIIFFFFFFTQICITQISFFFFFFFFFIQMLLNSWFSIRVWEDTDRQTDRQTEICHWAPFLFWAAILDLLVVVVVVVVVSCLLRFCFSRICLQLSLKDSFFLFPAASFLFG